MLWHSYAALSAHPDIDQVYVAIGAGQETEAAAALTGLKEPIFVQGGATRRESVHLGLVAIAAHAAIDQVLIHDAARPFLPTKVIEDLLDALLHAPGAVPALPVVDSLSRGTDRLSETVERENLWRIQTPQALPFRIYTQPTSLGRAQSQPTTRGCSWRRDATFASYQARKRSTNLPSQAILQETICPHTEAEMVLTSTA